jgi:hypothetical protein
MVQADGAKIDKEVVSWANKYFCENKVVLQILGINSVPQLIERILEIQTREIDQIVEL